MIVDQSCLCGYEQKRRGRRLCRMERGHIHVLSAVLKSVCAHFGIPLDKPVSTFSQEQMNKLLYGTGKEGSLPL